MYKYTHGQLFKQISNIWITRHLLRIQLMNHQAPENSPGASLVAQWVRICLPMRAEFNPWSGKVRPAYPHAAATGDRTPAACAPLRNKKSQSRKKSTQGNEEPSSQPEKATHSQEDPNTTLLMFQVRVRNASDTKQ